jgi:serine kinase of HPr protein (carbohydrate metabolism regulator)
MSGGGDSDGSLIHATSVAIDGRALLLAGPSGSGKSDLALRLIDRGALLISDDYTLLEQREDRLFACTAPTIAGKIEIRGIGIEEMAFATEAPVALMLLLDSPPERLPPEAIGTRTLLDCAIPALPFAPFETSAPIKAELALRDHGLKACAS